MQSSTVPTRFDIHADSDRKTADIFPRCLYILEIAQMKKILMATAIVLVSGSPLAFAATSGNMSPSALTTQHCSYLDQKFSQENFKSESARQVAESKAESLCRQDRHKNGGAEARGGGFGKGGGASARR
jgi:hypothetical protein